MVTFNSFYNDKAVELVKWYYEENNRIKAIKIFKAACNMEYNYRMSRWREVEVGNEIKYIKAMSVNMIRAMESNYVPTKKIEKENEIL